MRTLPFARTIAAGLVAVCTLTAQEQAPRHEIGLTLGGLFGPSRDEAATKVNPDAGIAFQANYGYRLFGGRKAAVYGEVHFLASPNRGVESTNLNATRDFASLFVTPGIRVKLKPAARVSPYVVVGGGYGQFEQSTYLLNGDPNPAARRVHRGVFDYGAGVDAKLWRFVGLRAEIRDFYSGSPLYNLPTQSGGQHNVVAGGGLVLRFR
ncbi:outer membrane beta-barrel protein [uncultured Paludibaculum sp.]|uniref:outer membrane beta-barrel protein n=1 Tax=uncultured Paludibaculum sp. TaxID=1765020 RepID=UPI002AABBD6A|nr:outer membrane beta-barrel protein [uncultured Paludibaculum sp.]